MPWELLIENVVVPNMEPKDPNKLWNVFADSKKTKARDKNCAFFAKFVVVKKIILVEKIICRHSFSTFSSDLVLTQSMTSPTGRGLKKFKSHID
jgi:hypothetical protein